MTFIDICFLTGINDLEINSEILLTSVCGAIVNGVARWDQTKCELSANYNNIVMKTILENTCSNFPLNIFDQT